MTSDDTIQRTYKTKLTLNNRERSIMAGCAGFSRFVYNWGLAEAKREHEETGKIPSPRAVLKKRLNAIKRDEFPWMADYPYVILQETFDDLDRAFKKFFRRIKNGEAELGYPRFKRRGEHDSFRFVRSIRIEEARIKLPRIGWLRLAERGYLPVGADVNSTTVSRQADSWYVSVQVEEPRPEPLEGRNGTLGVALGVRHTAVGVYAGSAPDNMGDALVFDSSRPLNSELRKLARLNREMARRTPGGANWQKTKTKLARLHRDIANARAAEQHNISAALTRDERPTRIVLPNIDLKGALQEQRAPRRKRRNFNRSLSDVALGELSRRIKYKSGWNGIDVMVADRYYPYASTCSQCGTINDIDSAARVYRCANCGLTIEREINAATNLAAIIEPVMHGGLPVELDEQSSTVKQEVGAGANGRG